VHPVNVTDEPANRSTFAAEWLREYGITAERVLLAAGPSPRNVRTRSDRVYASRDTHEHRATTVKPRSDSPAPTGSAISPFVDQPNARRPDLVFKLLAWRRPAMWAPVVNAIYAARDFFYGADDVPTSLAVQSLPAKERMSMPVAKAPAKTRLPSVEATPSSARLEAAVRKAARPTVDG